MLRSAEQQAAEERERQQEPICHDEAQAWRETDYDKVPWIKEAAA
jgi:hypothetical protein